METSQILQLIFSILPTIIVGVIAYHFFKTYTAAEAGKQRARLHQENQKTALPLRLQAYERLTLFLERIAIGNLVTRTKPYTDDVYAYEQLLTQTIDQEFEHNLSQQIYMTAECWNVIRTAKSATSRIIRKTAMSEKINTSDKLREQLLRDLLDNNPPSDAALAFIKKEVAEVMDI